MARDIGARPLRIALGAGHRHTKGLDGRFVSNGGANPYEFGRNGDKCVALARELRERGHDLYVYTPDDGAGLFPGNYNDAARSVVSYAAGHNWSPDWFVELHSEGSDPAKCGSFVIYPDDESGDIDTDVRDHGGIFAEMLTRRTGIAACTILTTSPGVTSEKQTGVGLEGFRLGVFAATQPLNHYGTTRLLFESGAHSCPHDRAIMDQESFPDLHALAVADAIEDFSRNHLGWTGRPAVEYPAPDLALVHALKGKRYLLVSGSTEVLAFRRRFRSLVPLVPQRWATDDAPAIGPAVTSDRLIGLILQDDGDTWGLTSGGARYNLTGQPVSFERRAPASS